MEIIEIVLVSAIVFPILATAGVMLFVRASIRKAKQRALEIAAMQQHSQSREKLIKSLKSAIDRQDQTLEVYRELNS